MNRSTLESACKPPRYAGKLDACQRVQRPSTRRRQKRLRVGRFHRVLSAPYGDAVIRIDMVNLGPC